MRVYARHDEIHYRYQQTDIGGKIEIETANQKALEDSAVEHFVPYTLRHTARLGAAAGGDVFVLARIAGHSTITVTQRYVHPQADAISRVFSASLSPVGTKLGTAKKFPQPAQRKKRRQSAA